MPFSLMAWYASSKVTAYTANSNLSSDTLFANGGSSTTYIVPSTHTQVIGAYGLGNTSGGGGDQLRFRLDAPSFLKQGNGFYPVFNCVDQNASIPATTDIPYNDIPYPIPVAVNDTLGVDILTGGTTAAANYNVIAIGSGRPNPSPGPWWPARFTSSTTLTAHAWTACSLTAEQNIAPGTYAIGGMRVLSASAIAARIIIPGYGYRPGCIGMSVPQTAEIDGAGQQGKVFRNGALGVWGAFDSTALPIVEVLANAADSSEAFILDIKKV